MFRLIALAASTAVLASANPLAHLTTEQLVQLGEELADWKASSAGKEAAEQEFMPKILSHEDELVRFHKTKMEVEEQRELNPDAEFGTDHPFALMTLEEFSSFVKRSGIEGADENALFGDAEEVTFNEAPKILQNDHRNGGCLAPVQQQGQCGSCWTFAAVGAVESANCLSSRRFVKLGEQRLVSCCNAGGSRGCQGGFPDHAIDWIAQNGICTQRDNPYISGGGNTGSCSGASRSCSPVRLSVGRAQRTSGDNGLANALSRQPTSVIVSAGNATWKNYRGGVVSQCPGGRGDHAVVSTGYTNSHFSIKNSWGTSWGDGGFMHLKRVQNRNGVCLVTSGVSYPMVR